MKYIFIFILFVHAVIHFMGFSKAFGINAARGYSDDISMFAGIIWLFTMLCMLATGILVLFNNSRWWIMALPAVLISQALVLVYWKDAKYGTLVNLLVFIIGLVGYADWKFNRMVKEEMLQLMKAPVPSEKIITNEMIAGLPSVVQKWLRHSGAVGSHGINQVRLTQKGIMRTKPSGRWMNFKATQYFTTGDPSFNWQAKVHVMPLLYMNGRDKYSNGSGEMLMKLLSLKSVVNVKGTPERNQGTLIRYLSEMCWFPSEALSDYITWKPVNDSSARAILGYKDVRATGVFHFTAEGDIHSFEAMRYGDFGGESSLEKWYVEAKDYKLFHGIKIPSKCEVTWKLDNGDFTWLKVELVTVDYNKAAMYKNQ